MSQGAYPSQEAAHLLKMEGETSTLRTPCHPTAPNRRHLNSLPLSCRATPLTWNICFMLSLVLISVHLAHPTEPQTALSPVT